ncbi:MULTISPECIES: sugar porter family MFS transporter [Asticcacaulis]|uniref:sugar porter family MFS transporter n=1 Tax=Asticcacaulis TaxID=76890 RepID=UPI001AE51974|nr:MULTISPECIES: sugar porter family MFS transporter [Asticcacaulis]MBP2160829.1 sugar porter (SP) family MFS transporter [Asticcacaulis solisilvae]MDR6801967.1 sugar porter (SP) family MFS transporter [Asticcacaulis sp. BE141]
MAQVNLKSVTIASLAGLLFGFDTAVISGVTDSLRTVFALDAQGLGWAVSVALWGTFVGALFMGRLGDAIGGRDALRIIGLMYVVSSLGCALAPDLNTFVISRFVLGLAVGGSSVLAPVYIAEIVPADRRGALVGLFQFNIVFGILMAYVSNFAVGSLITVDDVWRWKLGVAAAPAALFLALLFAIPQSARWLAAKNRIEEAVASLTQLGVANASAAVAEFAAADAKTSARLSWTQHRKPIIFAILLAMFNQLTGINAILYYLNDIFAAAGFDRLSADWQSIAVGGANLIATVIGMSFIDKLGRKTLLIAGAVGVAIALGGVAVIMATGEGRSLLLGMLLLFIVSFAFSQGAVIWVYLAEIFPTPVRATGQSLGSAMHWIMNALIAAAFPVIAAKTQALPFVFFAVCTVIQLVVVAKFFPETKGVELEEMEKRI